MMHDKVNVGPWMEGKLGSMCVPAEIKKQGKSSDVHSAMWTV
jgi:hypothetical protein